MSSSENVTIPNKLKQYVKSVNGSTPDPITGDVVVAGGGGDTSVGLIRRSIDIATTAWQGSGPFTYTYSDPDIAVGMCVLEAYLADEYAQLGINSYTIQNGSLIISTTVKPTADWNLTVALGMDGSTFMEDVSDLKTKVGNGTIDTTATTLIGAVNELNARKGSGITVSDTDSRSIATAISSQSQQKADKPVIVSVTVDANGANMSAADLAKLTPDMVMCWYTGDDAKLIGDLSITPNGTQPTGTAISSTVFTVAFVHSENSTAIPSVIKSRSTIPPIGVNYDITRIDVQTMRWYVETDPSLLPFAQTSIILQIIFDRNAGVQLCFGISGTAVAIKGLVNGTWQSWNRIL